MVTQSTNGEHIMSTDITMHNDAELADMFDNDEYLYLHARAATSFDYLEEISRDLFIFTDDQLNNFRTDWQEGRWDS